MKILSAIHFELKKTPWLIVTFILVAISTATIMQFNAVMEINDNTEYRTTTFQKQYINDLAKRARSLEEIEKAPAYNATVTNTNQVAIKTLKRLIPLVSKRNNQKITALLLAAFAVPNTNQPMLRQYLLANGFESTYDLRILSFIRKHHLRSSILTSPHEDVTNIMARTYSLISAYLTKIPLQAIIFCCSILITTSVFTLENRKNTTEFMNNIPINGANNFIIKGAIATTVIGACLLITFMMIVVFLKTVGGGHPFGSFHYPYYYLVDKHTYMITIGQYLLSLFGVNMIWLGIFSGMSFVLTQFRLTIVSQFFIIGVFTFMNGLELTKLFPATLRQLLPANFFNTRDLILNVSPTGATATFGVLVLIAWAAAFWLAGLLLLKFRRNVI